MERRASEAAREGRLRRRLARATTQIIGESNGHHAQILRREKSRGGREYVARSCGQVGHGHGNHGSGCGRATRRPKTPFADNPMRREAVRPASGLFAQGVSISVGSDGGGTEALTRDRGLRLRRLRTRRGVFYGKSTACSGAFEFLSCLLDDLAILIAETDHRRAACFVDHHAGLDDGLCRASQKRQEGRREDYAAKADGRTASDVLTLEHVFKKRRDALRSEANTSPPEIDGLFIFPCLRVNPRPKTGELIAQSPNSALFAGADVKPLEAQTPVSAVRL